MFIIVIAYAGKVLSFTQHLATLLLYLYTLLKSLAPGVLICDGCRGKSGEIFTSILSDLTTLNSNHPDIKPFGFPIYSRISFAGR
jgi:hypothetical protein